VNEVPLEEQAGISRGRVAQVPGEVRTTTGDGWPGCLAFGHLGVSPPLFAFLGIPLQKDQSWRQDCLTMQTRVSAKGQVVIPVPIREELGIRPGDSLDISVEQDRIVLTARKKGKKHEARIIEDPITGFPVIDVGPDAPVLTGEMVRELLVDFP